MKVLLVKYDTTLCYETLNALQKDIVHQVKTDGVLVLDARCKVEIVEIDNIKCSKRDDVMDRIRAGKGLEPLC